MKTQREIKFRALNSDTKEWEYGNLLKSETTVGGEYFINIAHPFAFDPNVRQVACIAATEGQFIGKVDMNGKEVYEGDKSQDAGVVVWNADSASFCIDYTDIELMEIGGDFSEWFIVSGNIYEN